MNREYTIPELRRLLENAEKEIETYKMQIVVLEQEVEKLGGTIPEGDELLARATEEKKKLEDLQDQMEAAEIAKREAEEEALKAEEEARREAELEALRAETEKAEEEARAAQDQAVRE